MTLTGLVNTSLEYEIQLITRVQNTKHIFISLIFQCYWNLVLVLSKSELGENELVDMFIRIHVDETLQWEEAPYWFYNFYLQNSSNILTGEHDEIWSRCLLNL